MDIKKLISDSLEETLSAIYTEMGINTGDISPMQLIKWDEITQEAAVLFSELIKQNMEDLQK